jgi:hypothetical protein
VLGKSRHLNLYRHADRCPSPGRHVVSFHRKCRGGRMPGRSHGVDRRTFSIRRLEGRRWRLRRTRSMEPESCLGTDAPRRRAPMSRRRAEKRTLSARTGDQNDGSKVRKKLLGAEENTPPRRRAWGTSMGRNWGTASRRIEEGASVVEFLRCDAPEDSQQGAAAWTVPSASGL